MLTSKVEAKKRKKTLSGCCSLLHNKTRQSSRRRELREMRSAARIHGCAAAKFICFVLLLLAQAFAFAEEEEMRVALAQPHTPPGESTKRRIRIQTV